MSDPRAQSLPQTLRTAWLTQATMTIMECVPQVRENKEFQELLLAYCNATGFHLRQTVVKLSNGWSARRDRWIGILTAPGMPPCAVNDLPSDDSCKVVGQVLPRLVPWPSSEHDQIELSLYELGKFEDYAVGGIDSLFLREDAPLPTCLHSAGNALQACALQTSIEPPTYSKPWPVGYSGAPQGHHSTRIQEVAESALSSPDGDVVFEWWGPIDSFG